MPQEDGTCMVKENEPSVLQEKEHEHCKGSKSVYVVIARRVCLKDK